MGMPVSAPRPTGTLMPPLPTMLMGTVKISDRYICAGSDSAPNSNAACGLAGIRMTSHDSYARAKS